MAGSQVSINLHYQTCKARRVSSVRLADVSLWLALLLAQLSCFCVHVHFPFLQEVHHTFLKHATRREPFATAREPKDHPERFIERNGDRLSHASRHVLVDVLSQDDAAERFTRSSASSFCVGEYLPSCHSAATCTRHHYLSLFSCSEAGGSPQLLASPSGYAHRRLPANVSLSCPLFSVWRSPGLGVLACRAFL